MNAFDYLMDNYLDRKKLEREIGMKHSTAFLLRINLNDRVEYPVDISLFFVHIHILEYGIQFYFHFLPSTNPKISFFFHKEENEK